MALLQEMKRSLPILAKPTKTLCKALKRQGTNISTDNELNISEVWDSGEAGGIVCKILENGGEAVIVSLTGLKVQPGHPLSKKILAYQKERIEKLWREKRFQTGEEMTIGAPPL